MHDEIKCSNISRFKTICFVLCTIATDEQDTHVRGFNVALVAHFKIPLQNTTQVQDFLDG
jgi:hypothetical protein